MTRQQVNYRPTPEATQVTARPDVQTVQLSNDPRRSSAFQLAEALGVAMPQIEKFHDDHVKRKTEEQQSKLAFYVEQFKKDKAEGAVSQAQVRNRFPETVPTIAAKIAEIVGQDEAEQKFGAVMQELLQNDEIRLNSGSRQKFIKEQREKLMATIPQGNDFYATGFVKGMEKQLSQFENQFLRETAAHHQEIQAKAFTKEVEEVLNSDGDLLAVDARYKGNTSLHDVERNKLVIKTATELAFASDDPTMLDKIPPRFLNAESKEDIAKMKIQIENQRFTNLRNSQYLKEVQRDEDLRKAKIGILNGAIEGKIPPAVLYKDNPEAYDYWLRMKDAPKTDEATSAANLQIMRGEILNGQTLHGSKSVKELTDMVLGNTELNVKDRKALIEALPSLVEGRRILQDPAVKEVFDLRIAPRLRELTNSVDGTIQPIVAGRNLHAEVTRAWDFELRRRVRAHYEDNQQTWPTGSAMQKIVDEAAIVAERHLESITKIGGSSDRPHPTAPKAAPAQPQAFDEKTMKKTEVMPGVYRYDPK